MEQELVLELVMEQELGLVPVSELALEPVPGLALELVPGQHRRQPRLLLIRKLRLIEFLSFSLTYLPF